MYIFHSVSIMFRSWSLILAQKNVPAIYYRLENEMFLSFSSAALLLVGSHTLTHFHAVICWLVVFRMQSRPTCFHATRLHSALVKRSSAARTLAGWVEPLRSPTPTFPQSKAEFVLGGSTCTGRARPQWKCFFPPRGWKMGWLWSRSKELLQSSCTVKLILIEIDYSIWDTWVINF